MNKDELKETTMNQETDKKTKKDSEDFHTNSNELIWTNINYNRKTIR